jgi:hypothetical protein
MPESGHESDHFHMWVGHCITAWADLEDGLFEILWHVLSCPQERAAIVYYKTPSLDARLTLVDELVRFVLPQTKSGDQPHADLRNWSAIKSDIAKGLGIRRRIAHQPVRSRKVTVALSSDDTLGKIELSYYEIYVSEMEALRGKPAKPETLHINDLIEHEAGLQELTARIHTFDADVLAKHIPKPAEPNPHKTHG